MSSYRKYEYEPYFEEIESGNRADLAYNQHAVSTPDKPVRHRLKRKPKKKINFLKVFVLVLLCALLFPIAGKVYDYEFLNKLRNDKIQVDFNEIASPSEKITANTHLLGKNFLGKVEYKHPKMAQLELNNEMPNLENRINYILKQYPRLKAGIFIWDYQTKNYISINGEEQFSAASIIKVPILVQMFKRIESGDLDLYEKFKMTSYYRTGGSGYLQYRPEGAEFEMNDLANYMIRTSDNTATNMILSAVGGSHEMDMALRSWGFSKTYVKTWLPDLYGTNVTTPKDMATILYNADNPDFLSLENRSRIVEIMSKVKNTSLLKQGIPDSAQLIHKTGDIGEMLGDVGVVTMPDGRRYIIAVMVKRRWNDYSARTMINAISSTVYNAFATRNF